MIQIQSSFVAVDAEMVPDIPFDPTALPDVQHGPLQYGFVASYCPAAQVNAALVRVSKTTVNVNTTLRVMLRVFSSFIQLVCRKYLDCRRLFLVIDF